MNNYSILCECWDNSCTTTLNENIDIQQRIANEIFNRYPTIQELENGCKQAYAKTHDKKILNFAAYVKVQMQQILFYYPEVKRDKEKHYYLALYKVVSLHKYGRTALLMLGSMFGVGALGGVVGHAVADAEGTPWGALAGMFTGGIAGGIASDKIVKNSLNKIYDSYTKDNDINNMMSKI